MVFLMLPLWVRRLPHNLSTVRPFFAPKFDLLAWGIALPSLHLKLNKGDKDYLFHYEKGPYLSTDLGPFHLQVGLKDTPEKNAWIP